MIAADIENDAPNIVVGVRVVCSKFSQCDPSTLFTHARNGNSVVRMDPRKFAQLLDGDHVHPNLDLASSGLGPSLFFRLIVRIAARQLQQQIGNFALLLAQFTILAALIVGKLTTRRA